MSLDKGNYETAYLGLGSNLGNREENMKKAVAFLDANPGIEVERLSSWYETAPVGKTDQGWFLNSVARIKTTMPARELLRAVLAVEQQLGRVRRERWGPRTIDIDILLYDDINVTEPDLEIPHPRMLERAFVLIPLAEIAPDLLLPDGRRAAVAARDKFTGQEVLLYTGNR
ncbi:2-amino-4-hydroxy-6-hydroxymethyldihydropteridine diphosphokinase [Moorella sp. Hama-1]|uniref:2-amino-4-hydroxy-6- hydroxymethyldihydropteridine diphosphokinase n=1 Tax=Moorella sp. Hama-1 TaxID=2138101 RepID=UPI000D6479FC|nr:2-amino-4-hydroxy-6-hydroxymethyldihydropteridine diphosphokinase [Moorella sp. Hama-1]MDN5362524.1 2-amino-4-hydroxy-6-hydroxymethyldihydropteridine diphosphokinase [Moorella sp. (in: firmicutes)]BCV20095.1 2-amino-4-hydroxy-6-hydroxymethyldihydropteridine diphosphokinase [Moorella sp. Hama-1]